MCRIVLICIFSSAAVGAQGPEWVFAHGPFASGDVVAVHPDGDIFGIVNGDLYASWNEGRSWNLRSSPGLQGGKLVVQPNGTMFGLSGVGSVIRSTNRGSTWQEVLPAETGREHLATAHDGSLCVASDSVVHCSPDGLVWVALLPLVSQYPVSRMSAGNGFEPLVVRYNEYYIPHMLRFDADTETWVLAGHYGIGAVNAFVNGLDEKLYVVGSEWITKFTNHQGGVFRWNESIDGWDQLRAGTSLGVFVFEDGELLIATPDSLLWDGPQSLSSPLGQIVRTSHGSFLANTVSGYRCFGDYEGALFCPHFSGAYRQDQNLWHQAGIVPAQVFSLEESPDGTVLVGTEKGVLTIEDRGWVAAGWNYGQALAIEKGSSSVYIAGWDRESDATDGGLFRLGEDWPLSFPGDCGDYGCNAFSVIESAGGTLLASVSAENSEDSGIYRSVDGGENWVHRLVNIKEVRSLHETSAGQMLAGVRNGGPDPGGVYRSINDGISWSLEIAGLTNTEVHSVYSSIGVELAGTEDGVFVSSGGGDWSGDGLTGDTVYAFVTAGDGLLAGTSSGLFRRTAPNEWRRYGTGLEDRSVLSLLVTEFEGEELVVAGTDAGVYLSRPGLITVGQEQPASPASAANFHPPYPNPARDVITLTLDLEQRSHVRIRAFDTLGREVAQPVNQLLPAGAHQFEWPVGRLASGAYLLRFEAGDVLLTQRVIVLR